MDYLARLEQATRESHVCVGLDPVLERLPEPVEKSVGGMKAFLEAVILATAPYAAAYKPNLAFFEALGPEGDDLLARTVSLVRRYAPNALIIGDGKRGDIGSTASYYARALWDRWGFDATTVNPYFGWDGIAPFVEREEKGVYLLCATSNPSSEELQSASRNHDNTGVGEDLPMRISKHAQEKWNPNKNLGLVVGATRKTSLTNLRLSAPALPWLIPGIGAQGGDLQAAVLNGFFQVHGFLMPVGGAPARVNSLINASRSILYADSGPNYAEAAAREAKSLRDAIARAVKLIQEGGGDHGSQ